MTSGEADSVSGREGGQFPLTLWSVIVHAGDPASPGNHEALSRFCEAYWYPLYAFARRSNRTREEAEDLTQDFFVHLVENRVLTKVQRNGSGRFRSFLLTAFQNFSINEWKKGVAQKRGGGQRVISIDDTAEVRYQQEATDHLSPERLYDRQWALAAQDRVFNHLRDECRAAGNGTLFECLQNFLPGAPKEMPYTEAGKILGMAEEAVRMAVSRLRHRYGKALREEVAMPGMKKEEIDDELRYLMEILSSH